jgi:hypothetical protein
MYDQPRLLTAAVLSVHIPRTPRHPSGPGNWIDYHIILELNCTKISSVLQDPGKPSKLYTGMYFY